MSTRISLLHYIVFAFPSDHSTIFRSTTKIKLIFICWLAFHVFSYAKTIQIGIGGGSTLVTGSRYYTNNLNIEIYDPYSSEVFHLPEIDGLDFNSEYHVSINARILCDGKPIVIYSDVNYLSLSGKGRMTIIPDPVSSYQPPSYQVKSECNLSNLSIGIEYKISKKQYVPILSCGILLNYLSDVKIKSQKDPDFQHTIMNSGIRCSLCTGMGLYYQTNTSWTIGITTQYVWMNLTKQKRSEALVQMLETRLILFYTL